MPQPHLFSTCSPKCKSDHISSLPPHCAPRKIQTLQHGIVLPNCPSPPSTSAKWDGLTCQPKLRCFYRFYLEYPPLSTPPRSVILSASAGHRLLACLHSQNQSTRHTTGWICSLRRLSLPGWPSREDLPIGPRPVLSIFHLVIESLSQMHLIQKSNIYQTEDRVAMLVKCGLG